MFRAARSPNRRQRRAGLAIASVYLLPLLLIAIVAAVSVVRIALH